MKKKSVRAGRSPVLRPVKQEAWGNQWVANPRQELFVSLYMTPGSATFGNAYQSALKAGYKESYARAIAKPAVANKWIKEYKDIINLSPDHIIAALQKEATDTRQNRGSERIKALELLAKMNGMLVERSVNMNVNIEQALSDLK